MAARRLAQSMTLTPRVVPGILSEWLLTRPDLINANSCERHKPLNGSRWPGRGMRVKAGVMLLGVAPIVFSELNGTCIYLTIHLGNVRHGGINGDTPFIALTKTTAQDFNRVAAAAFRLS